MPASQNQKFWSAALHKDTAHKSKQLCFMEETTQLREVGGRRWEHAQPSYLPCGLWLFAQGCLPKPRAREKEARFEAGKLRRKTLGQIFGQKCILIHWCVVREVAVNGAPSEVPSRGWSAARSELRDSILHHCRDNSSNRCCVCFSVSSLWGRCVTAPEALKHCRPDWASPRPPWRVWQLLFYTDLSWHLIWDEISNDIFQLLLSLSFFFFIPTYLSLIKQTRKKYVKKTKTTHLDKT